MKQLSPYEIHWFALVPVKGIATKKDQKKAGCFYQVRRTPVITNHAPTKEAALAKIEALRGKLSKQYRAYIFTDKQFGMAGTEGDILIGKSGHKVKLTQKQKEQSFITN